MNKNVPLKSALMADIYRNCGRASWPLVVKYFVFRRAFRVVATLRLCQAATEGPVRRALPLFRFLHRVAAGRAGVDVPWNVDIGPGFIINHAWGLVIAPGTRIGRNVSIFHGATLGRRDRLTTDGSRDTGYPCIEDDVWIGPHAVIVGGVTIGRGSRIAANAFVVKDVPPYSTVVGNPASVARENCTPDCANRVEFTS